MHKVYTFVWAKEQIARIAKATKSTFTGLLQSYESAIMDMIFVLVHRNFRFQLAVPMLDGGIWFPLEVKEIGTKQFLNISVTGLNENTQNDQIKKRLNWLCSV